MSEKSERVKELEDKPTRDAFVSSQMSIPLAFQIQALREQQGLTQKQLAEKAGMLQPRIAAMEHPSGSEPNLRTLKRLASAFDVALIVRFAPFSELVEWADRFSPDTFVVPSFHDDPGIHQDAVASHMYAKDLLLTGSLQQQNMSRIFNASLQYNGMPSQRPMTEGTSNKGELTYVRRAA